MTSSHFFRGLLILFSIFLIACQSSPEPDTPLLLSESIMGPAEVSGVYLGESIRFRQFAVDSSFTDTSTGQPVFVWATEQDTLTWISEMRIEAMGRDSFALMTAPGDEWTSELESFAQRFAWIELDTVYGDGDGWYNYTNFYQIRFQGDTGLWLRRLEENLSTSPASNWRYEYVWEGRKVD